MTFLGSNARTLFGTMKNVFTLLILFCAFHNAWSQQPAKAPLLVTPEEYDALKASGGLNGNFSVTWNAAATEADQTQMVNLPEDYFERGGGADECACIQPIDETFSVVPFTGGVPPLYRNDDGYTNQINLPFTFCLYGQTYNSCYINNNGNISFGNPYATFSASAFPSAQYVMVAPFWGDVDTRNTQSGVVHYRLTSTSLTVLWDRVGYYNSMADKVNTFQVIISNGQDPIIPGGNVSFCYGDMQWTTGSASSGVNGFGGVPATVGCNLGDGTNFIQIGRFDQPGTVYNGPGGAAGGVSWLDNLIFNIDACTNQVSNVPPLSPSLTNCETLYLCQGSEIAIQFLGPEVNQTITLNYTIPPGSGITAQQTSSTGATQLFLQAGQNSVLGSYDFVVTATDNGTPALSTVVQFTLVIIDAADEIQILGTPAICSGQSTTLSIPAGYSSIQWNTGAASNTIFVNQPGTYSVTASLGGCVTTGSVVVTQGVTPVPVIVGETQICAGTETTLSLTETYNTVVWSNGAVTPQISVGPGNYAVTVTTDLGCPGGDNHQITAFPVPQMTTEVNECDLDAVISGNNLAGSWSFSSEDGGSITFSPATAQTTNVSVGASQYGDYELTFTEAQCNIEVNIPASFRPVPSFELADTVLCLGSSLELRPVGNFPEDFVWWWSTGEDTPYISVNADSLLAEFGWSASNICGTSSGIVTIVAEPCAIVIPNIFTPNNDGYNNAFEIVNIDKYPGSTLKVFNRWGAEVYSSDSYANNWSPAADEAPDGTYYYILGWKSREGVKFFEGYVMILR